MNNPVSKAKPSEPKDDYQPVDPGELSFELKGFYSRSVVGEGGIPKTVGGEVEELICEGKKIELVSNKFDGEFLETKQYGKIKIQFSSSLTSSGFSLWLTPKQKEALIKAFKSASKSKTADSAKATEPDTTKRTSEPFEDQYVLVPVKCVVYHSGYKGVIVSPGVSKPTEGTVVSLDCNGKKIEISSKAIVDGYIETKEFGKIGVRFGSMVATVGAGDFTSVRKGSSVPERAIEIYVQKSKQKDFIALISK